MSIKNPTYAGMDSSPLIPQHDMKENIKEIGIWECFESVVFHFSKSYVYLYHFAIPGPMVWYQKFEYAVGHWLQKTAEHVFGSVLCSPGCFSLFRGSAIMDDNVLKKYTTTSKRASEYVQYDQGPFLD